jgi:superfamily II DNA/RNA helicase
VREGESEGMEWTERLSEGVHRDLIAQAHNGLGKTTCFVLAMLSRWVRSAPPPFGGVLV